MKLTKYAKPIKQYLWAVVNPFSGTLLSTGSQIAVFPTLAAAKAWAHSASHYQVTFIRYEFDEVRP